MSVTTAQATTLLENVLFESATLASANAAQWVTLSQNSAADSTVAGLATAMANSAEAGIAQQVVRYYEGALDRAPTASEISFYVGVAEAGLSASQIAQGAGAVSTATWGQIATYFADSSEFQSLTAGGNVIPVLFQNILGRSPTADDTTFYQKVLAGGTSLPTLLEYLVNSSEYQTKVGAGIATLPAGDGQTAVSSGTGNANPVVTPPDPYDDSAGAVTVAMTNHYTSGTVTVAGGSAFTATSLSTIAVASTALSTINISGLTSSGDLTIVLGQPPSGNSFTFTDTQASSVKLDLSHLSGTSTPTYTLPAGSDDFSYGGVAYHLAVGSASVELIGVSASQVTLLPAHS